MHVLTSNGVSNVRMPKDCLSATRWNMTYIASVALRILSGSTNPECATSLSMPSVSRWSLTCRMPSLASMERPYSASLPKMRTAPYRIHGIPISASSDRWRDASASIERIHIQTSYGASSALLHTSPMSAIMQSPNLLTPKTCR